jgi:hypothetical protein
LRGHPADLNLDLLFKKVRYVIYGDDNALSIADLPEINFHSLRASIQKLGLDYTDELKGKGGVIPPYRPILDGNFIGCGFKEDSTFGTYRVLAPLRIASVVEAPQWDKNGRMTPLDKVQVVENTNLHLAIHGEGVFSEKVPLLAKACKKAYGVWPKYTDYGLAFAHAQRLDAAYYCPLLKEGVDFGAMLDSYRKENLEKNSCDWDNLPDCM